MYEKIYELLRKYKEGNQEYDRNPGKKFRSIIYFAVLVPLAVYFFSHKFMKFSTEESIVFLIVNNIIIIFTWILNFFCSKFNKSRYIYGIHVIAILWGALHTVTIVLVQLVLFESSDLIKQATNIGTIIVIVVYLVQVVSVSYDIKKGQYAVGGLKREIVIPRLLMWIGIILISPVFLPRGAVKVFSRTLRNIGVSEDAVGIYIIAFFVLLFCLCSKIIITTLICQFVCFKLTDEEYAKINSSKENRRHFELQEREKERRKNENKRKGARNT